MPCGDSGVKSFNVERYYKIYPAKYERMIATEENQGRESWSRLSEQACSKQVCLTLLWYHGVSMTPGLFDRQNIPNFEIKSFQVIN